MAETAYVADQSAASVSQFMLPRKPTSLHGRRLLDSRAAMETNTTVIKRSHIHKCIEYASLRDCDPKTRRGPSYEERPNILAPPEEAQARSGTNEHS
jgi:hypothetical protein